MSRAKILPCVVLALGLALPLAAQEGGPVRIAVVNLDAVILQSPGGKALQEKLTAFQQTVRAEIEAKQNDIREVRQRIADGANSLSEDKLAELQKEYEDANIAARRFQDDKQREAQKIQNEGLKEIETQLEPVFEQIRDEDQLDLILNNTPGVIIMAGDRINITQKVIDRLTAAAGGG